MRAFRADAQGRRSSQNRLSHPWTQQTKDRLGANEQINNVSSTKTTMTEVTAVDLKDIFDIAGFVQVPLASFDRNSPMVPWPSLRFTGHEQMMATLREHNLIANEKALKYERMLHVIECAKRRKECKCPVAFLWGDRRPGNLMTCYFHEEPVEIMENIFQIQQEYETKYSNLLGSFEAAMSKLEPFLKKALFVGGDCDLGDEILLSNAAATFAEASAVDAQVSPLNPGSASTSAEQAPAVSPACNVTLEVDTSMDGDKTNCVPRDVSQPNSSKQMSLPIEAVTDTAKADPTASAGAEANEQLRASAEHSGTGSTKGLVPASSYVVGAPAKTTFKEQDLRTLQESIMDSNNTEPKIVKHHQIQANDALNKLATAAVNSTKTQAPPTREPQKEQTDELETAEQPPQATNAASTSSDSLHNLPEPTPLQTNKTKSTVTTDARNSRRVLPSSKSSLERASADTPSSTSSSIGRTSSRQKTKRDDETASITVSVKKPSPPPKVTGYINIPFFRDVKSLLEKAGHTFRRGFYCLPGYGPQNGVLGEHIFDSERSYRNHLCAHGVPDSTAWTNADREIIGDWVKYAVLKSTKSEGKIAVYDELSPSQVMKLLFAIGITYRLDPVTRTDVYLLPGVKVRDGVLNVTMFQSDVGPEGLMAYLCKFGLPDDAEVDKISRTELLSMELYLAGADVQRL